MHIYIFLGKVRTLLELAEELLGKMSDWVSLKTFSVIQKCGVHTVNTTQEIIERLTNH